MTEVAIQPAFLRRHQPWSKIVYIQILIALGVLIGHVFPDLGKALKPLGDGSIALIEMMIAPVIFCTWCTASPRWTPSSASAGSG
jgi:aerobic C4-dicarboxylate transport protein